MKTQVTQEENAASQSTQSTRASVKTTKQGAIIGKTGVSGKPIQARYKTPIQAKYGGDPFPARRPLNQTPIVSSNTRRAQKRAQADQEKKGHRKKKGLLAISEPEEFKKAIVYLKQSATATKVIDFLEGLDVIIGVHVDHRRPDTVRTGYQVMGNNIRWFSKKGIIVGNSTTEKEKLNNPKKMGYMSPAMGLWHEMMHAAIEHGYLEKYGITLEKNVDRKKYDDAEHKFIVEMEHVVIDELKAADKNIKETKRATYHGGIGNAIFDDVTSASNPKEGIFDLYTKAEYIKMSKEIKNQNRKHQDLLDQYK